MINPGHSREDEERYLARTLDEIRRQIDELALEISERRGSVVSVRTQMWQELPHQVRDWDDVIALTEGKQVLDQQEREYVFYRGMLPRLERMADSPYFGRIDFRRDGSAQTDVIYLGIASLVEARTGEHLIFDWRAPIAGMFYDFEPGRAHFRAPQGLVEGELLLKRQYRIKNGKLLYLFDTDVKIDDDILQEILGRSVDHKMKSIVQSIQREQNRVIRDEAHRLLIVQGPAGSGKTSIALHRVAYFLYRYRSVIGPEHIAVLSPNRIFNDYIGNVLPELGEENMRQLTLQEIAEKAIRIPCEDYADQMEYLLSRRAEPEFSARTAGIAYKSSSEFFEALKAYVRRIEEGAVLPLATIEYLGKPIMTQDEMRRLLIDTYSYLPYHKRLEKLARRVYYLLEPLQEARVKELQDELERHPDHHRSSSKELRKLARARVQEELQPLRDRLAGMTRAGSLDLYGRLFTEAGLLEELVGREKVPPHWDAIRADTAARLAEQRLGYEDIAPVLYLKAALGEAEPFGEIRHLVIDEMQDYSALHLAALGVLFKGAAYTLLGDLNQAIHPYLRTAEHEAIASVMQVRGASEIVRLRRSYRNTFEIAAFAKAILEGGEDVEPIERHGPKPRLVRLASHERLLARVAGDLQVHVQEGLISVGIICKTAAACERVFAGLKPLVDVQMVTKHDDRFTHGAVVIPSYLAKGLEFDAVLICDAGAASYGDEVERKLLYTACTRALHRLCLYYTGERSPLLARVDPELYDEEEES